MPEAEIAIQHGVRRTQAERTEQMRARLSRAAHDIVVQRGHAGLRMAAVAEAAGVSQGALLHHFPDKNEVTKAAIHHALARADLTSRAALAAQHRDLAAVTDALITDLRGFFFGEDFWVTLGITLEAAKNEELATDIGPVVAELRRPVYALWSGRLVSFGVPKGAADTAVRTVAALVSGLAIRRLWAQPDDIDEAIIADWRDGFLASHAG